MSTSFVYKEALTAMSDEIPHQKSTIIKDKITNIIHNLKVIAEVKKHISILPYDVLTSYEMILHDYFKKYRMLCLVNGYYSNLMASIAENIGMDVKRITVDPGNEISSKLLLEHIAKKYNIVTMTHCESSTGVMNPIEDLCDISKDHGLITIVNSASTLGGTRVDLDRRNIDICFGSSGKCIGSPIGNTIFMLKDSTSINKEKNSNTFFDLKKSFEAQIVGEMYPQLQIPMINALYASTNRIITEGIENVFQRHSETASFVRKKMLDFGFEIFPNSEIICSPSISSFTNHNTVLKQEDFWKKGVWNVLINSENIRIGHLAACATMSSASKAIELINEKL